MSIVELFLLWSFLEIKWNRLTAIISEASRTKHSLGRLGLPPVRLPKLKQKIIIFISNCTDSNSLPEISDRTRPKLWSPWFQTLRNLIRWELSTENSTTMVFDVFKNASIWETVIFTNQVPRRNVLKFLPKPRISYPHLLRPHSNYQVPWIIKTLLSSLSRKCCTNFHKQLLNRCTRYSFYEKSVQVSFASTIGNR